VLDYGNDTIRELEEDLKQFKINLWEREYLIFPPSL
jgi:hypothetical protein